RAARRGPGPAAPAHSHGRPRRRSLTSLLPRSYNPPGHRFRGSPLDHAADPRMIVSISRSPGVLLGFFLVRLCETVHKVCLLGRRIRWTSEGPGMEFTPIFLLIL